MRQGRSAPLPATDPNDRCEATHNPQARRGRSGASTPDCGDRLIGLVDRIYSARYDGGVCPHSNQLCEIIVHFGEQRWPAIVRNDFLYLSVPSGTTASKRSISLSLPMYCGMTTS